jgi:hypothetical protein
LPPPVLPEEGRTNLVTAGPPELAPEEEATGPGFLPPGPEADPTGRTQEISNELVRELSSGGGFDPAALGALPIGRRATPADMPLVAEPHSKSETTNPRDMAPLVEKMRADLPDPENPEDDVDLSDLGDSATSPQETPEPEPSEEPEDGDDDLRTQVVPEGGFPPILGRSEGPTSVASPARLAARKQRKAEGKPDKGEDVLAEFASGSAHLSRTVPLLPDEDPSSVSSPALGAELPPPGQAWGDLEPDPDEELIQRREAEAVDVGTRDSTRLERKKPSSGTHPAEAEPDHDMSAEEVAAREETMKALWVLLVVLLAACGVVVLALTRS